MLPPAWPRFGFQHLERVVERQAAERLPRAERPCGRAFGGYAKKSASMARKRAYGRSSSTVAGPPSTLISKSPLLSAREVCIDPYARRLMRPAVTTVEARRRRRARI
jgi:hypothetical protein